VADITTGMTTAGLWSWAGTAFGERPFLVHLDADGHRAEFSYAAFAASIHRAAHAFDAVGVGVGDRVLLHVGNSPEMLTAMFGLAEIGAVAVPVGLDTTPAEMLRAYQASGARWAVVDQSRLADHLVLRKEQGVADRGLLAVGPTTTSAPGSDRLPPATAAGVQSYQALCAAQPDRPMITDLTGQTVTELLYTSGTTAVPKGVMVTQANLVFSGHYGVWQMSLRSDDRLFTTMPACHSNFQLAALMPVLVAGATLVMAERYSASHFWQQIRQERATVAQLIAMMARTLLLQPVTAEDGRHQLRDALSFMPLSTVEKADFERRFRVPLLNSYGSTESIGWAVTDPPQGERRWPSVGRAGLGYDVGIFDEVGHELPAGQVGEFRIKGVPGVSLMLGYYDDPESTAAALTPDGWLRTHDEGYCDADGWFYFVDRAVNLIKRAGENISTCEVECVLTSHPLIAEAAVIGVPDPVRDKAVKAFVRVQPGAELTVEAITDYCRRQLAPFKVPEFIELVEDFPRTGSMKIEKRCLHH
jgi:carnitine-CoA ligase